LRVLIVTYVMLIVTADPGMGQEKGVVTEDSVLTVEEEHPETIPLGYGVTRNPEELTGAVSRVEVSDLAESMVINPENGFYGRFSGLTVLQNSGLPPTSPTFYVRGRGTFTSAAPLVLVDGFERAPFSDLSPGSLSSLSLG